MTLIIQQIRAMPIYGHRALDICYPLSCQTECKAGTTTRDTFIGQ